MAKNQDKGKSKKDKKTPVFQIGMLLAAQGVKHDVFADLVGVNTGTVSEWINHKTYPDAKRLPKIAEVLNVNMQLLLLKTEVKDGKSPAQIENDKRENAQE